MPPSVILGCKSWSKHEGESATECFDNAETASEGISLEMVTLYSFSLQEATEKDEEVTEADNEEKNKDLDVELPFLTGPLPKDRKEEKEDMLDQMVPPQKRENEEKTYATKRFEERFR